MHPWKFPQHPTKRPLEDGKITCSMGWMVRFWVFISHWACNEVIAQQMLTVTHAIRARKDGGESSDVETYSVRENSLLRTTTCLVLIFCFLISFDILGKKLHCFLLPRASELSGESKPVGAHLQNKETFEFVGREIPLNPRFGVGPT